jgi:hypothetical protein
MMPVRLIRGVLSTVLTKMYSRALNAGSVRRVEEGKTSQGLRSDSLRSHVALLPQSSLVQHPLAHSFIPSHPRRIVLPLSVPPNKIDHRIAIQSDHAPNTYCRCSRAHLAEEIPSAGSQDGRRGNVALPQTTTYEPQQTTQTRLIYPQATARTSRGRSDPHTRSNGFLPPFSRKHQLVLSPLVRIHRYRLLRDVRHDPGATASNRHVQYRHGGGPAVSSDGGSQVVPFLRRGVRQGGTRGGIGRERGGGDR